MVDEDEDDDEKAIPKTASGGRGQKWTTQDLSNIERNKAMKNQSIRGIPRGLAYNNQPGGVNLAPPPLHVE